MFNIELFGAHLVIIIINLTFAVKWQKDMWLLKEEIFRNILYFKNE